MQLFREFLIKLLTFKQKTSEASFNFSIEWREESTFTQIIGDTANEHYIDGIPGGFKSQIRLTI